jgi:hypothetical protein
MAIEANEKTEFSIKGTGYLNVTRTWSNGRVLGCGVVSDVALLLLDVHVYFHVRGGEDVVDRGGG